MTFIYLKKYKNEKVEQLIYNEIIKILKMARKAEHLRLNNKVNKKWVKEKENQFKMVGKVEHLQ